MKTWSVQDAQARFSELLETCLREGPQLVTRRGEKAAVLVSAAQWQRLADAGKPTLKALLSTDVGRFDLPIPPRGKKRPSSPARFRLALNVPARYQRRVRAQKTASARRVVAWLRSLDQRDLFISAVTLGELQAGIEVTRERTRQRPQKSRRG